MPFLHELALFQNGLDSFLNGLVFLCKVGFISTLDSFIFTLDGFQMGWFGLYISTLDRALQFIRML